MANQVVTAGAVIFLGVVEGGDVEKTDVTVGATHPEKGGGWCWGGVGIYWCVVTQGVWDTVS